MRVLILASALLALAACQKSQPQNNNDGAPTAEAGPHKGVDRSHRGQPTPDVAFGDPNGDETSLAEHSGKPTLVNLWATWCAPCVKELPTLNRLAKAKNDALQVIAISQDDGPHPSVEAFLKSKAPDLAPYQDSKMALSGKLNAEVLPTSVLYDARGKEVWRYVGDLDWTSAEAARLLSEANAPKGS
jgi:thiol-disulfide isomerase/thioredoxin